MTNTKIYKLLRASAICLVVLTATSCAADEVGMLSDSQIPPFSAIKRPDTKKTITIKRKKPSIENPSPRPLSAYPANDASYDCESYDDYASYDCESYDDGDPSYDTDITHY